jgi:AcrR family transcriptional regulator
VGKQTIYRRWTTKADLLLDAVRHRIDAVPNPPDTGS